VSRYPTSVMRPAKRPVDQFCHVHHNLAGMCVGLHDDGEADCWTAGDAGWAEHLRRCRSCREGESMTAASAS
jgi:hypothetical protein